MSTRGKRSGIRTVAPARILRLAIREGLPQSVVRQNQKLSVRFVLE
jgi:hypothetical protein